MAQCELGDGDRWAELVELNDDRIDDPNLIEAGWALVLPEPGADDCPERPTSTTSVSRAPSAAPRQEFRRVKVTAVKPSGRGQARGNLAGIRNCESSGDYGAVSANGRYRGAYQFDRQTWAAVGGSGDPAAASADEQDRRAAILYRQRGTSAWP
ncbi:MAG: transglycosylase family protein, partial [Actinobacteria bacterium]|nr:transglycosylase family protein [Actinomycetota bacterium]